LTEKDPHLLVDGAIDVGRFAATFDYAIAMSVFTHVPANAVERCLVNVAATLAPGGKFFATYFEAPTPHYLVPLSHAGGAVITHSDRDPFHYHFSTFLHLVGGLPLTVENVGVWEPRGVQHMLRFTKADAARSESATAPDSIQQAPAPSETSVDARSRGQELVRAIRERGEAVAVDLGCGFRKHGNIGIDVTSDGTHADLLCRLGFDPIPLDDNTVDKVWCRDFLEHIPKGVYLEREGRMYYPIVQLMNEVWRILKTGGTFESLTPCYPHAEVHQDPTHLSVWTENSMGYFTGKYPIAKIYGVKVQFELVEQNMQQFYLHAILRKK
jgi:SAM-dependent methyltransferase